MKPRILRSSARTPALAAQQTREAPLASLLYLDHWGNLTHGLTPTRLRRILAEADEGDIHAQHQLFNDMEDCCEHLAAEMGKRKRAILTVDWNVVPARQDDAQAERIAETVREWLDAIPNFEDMLLDMADGIGHGFAALEMTWSLEGGVHLPVAMTHRPQSWFMTLQEDRNELRLRDGSATGAELWPYGWIVHTHRSKSGWLPRAGLFRVLAWAYLVRTYALDASVQYTQVHGMPLRVGKYLPGCSEEDKAALLSALRNLGRDAAGIIPVGMDILFQTPPGVTRDIPAELATRCEQGMSKAILGGTLTSQADGRTSTNALGQVHNEVRHDLLVSDALQMASTITNQLIAPLCALNLGISDRRLVPYFRFDTRQAEDIAVYADALPKLVSVMDISADWAHERLKIPRAKNRDDILGGASRASKEPPQPPAARTKEDSGSTPRQDALNTAQSVLDAMEAAPALQKALQQSGDALLAPVIALLEKGISPADMDAALAGLYPDMDEATLAATLAKAFFVAEVWGRLHA